MKNTYLKKANDNMPHIYEREIRPDVNPGILQKDDEFVIDLGNHYVGYFSFVMNYYDIYIDAPVRLSIQFCETKRELEDDFSSYKGSLSSSWLAEEIVNIDFPGEYKMPRRYAARYIKIKVVACPRKLVLKDFCFRAVSSADTDSLIKCDIADEELKAIDSVAVNTLKNCMHRIFEDGPKRDRRLWIGDLRLEAISDYVTFNQTDIVRRCLYLFAAGNPDKNGYVPAFVYENPDFVSGHWYLTDYSLLYGATVCDYYNHTGDEALFNELYPVVSAQLEAAYSSMDDDGVVTYPGYGDIFIDWCEGLQKITAFHGVYLYVLDILINTLKKLNHKDVDLHIKRYNEAKNVALNLLFDKDKKAFVNSKDEMQYSVHSAVWMILGGAVEGDEAIGILSDVLDSKDSVKPFTPYMHHYVVEAMVKLGMMDEACSYIKLYWGSMLDLGADTFYEVHVPGDPDFSPYNDRMINSMCHAWSCTPSYFIRNFFAKK